METCGDLPSDPPPAVAQWGMVAGLTCLRACTPLFPRVTCPGRQGLLFFQLLYPELSEYDPGTGGGWWASE